MKATMEVVERDGTVEGSLVIEPENGLEQYALKHWLKDGGVLEVRLTSTSSGVRVGDKR